MNEIIALSTSAVVTFLNHNFWEKRLTRNGRRPLKLVVKGYQIHHSFFGLVMILLGLVFLSHAWLMFFFGYGLGNILQHKKAHNNVNEKGMVFITKWLSK